MTNSIDQCCGTCSNKAVILSKAVRRKVSTSQWSRRKRFYLETGETSCPSALRYPGAASSCQREEKVDICCFPQQYWASLPSWFAFLRNSLWCRLRSLLLSCQSHSKAGYSGLLPPPPFHRVNQELTGSLFLGVHFSKDGIQPFYSNSNIPFAWLNCCHAVISRGVFPHWGWGHE